MAGGLRRTKTSPTPPTAEQTNISRLSTRNRPGRTAPVYEQLKRELAANRRGKQRPD